MVKYNAANVFAVSLMTYLESCFKVKNRKINIDTDLTADKALTEMSAELSLRLGHIVYLVSVFGFELNKRRHRDGEQTQRNDAVGEPICTPDGLTLVPISKVSFGFGGAGGRLPGNNKDDFGGGSATGVKIEPIGFLAVKEGGVRMINVMPPAQNSVDRLFELVPQVLDKVNFKD